MGTTVALEDLLMPRSLFLLLSGLALLAAHAAAEPFLITDLNTSAPPATEPAATPGDDSVELGGYLYFAADDGMHGRELWRTDGTGPGTGLVADICPGPCSSFPTDLAVYGDLVGFAATNGFHGREIWLSNGTRGGTRMPKDLCPGACSSLSWGASPVTIGEHLFFTTRTLTRTQYRVGLAVTDGTAAGTRQLLETNSAIQAIGELGGRLAFAGPGAAWASALWWSDGTPEGTYPALDLCTGSPCQSSLDRAFVVGGRIVFFQSGAQGGIWATDGTAGGTRKIGDATAPALPKGSVLWNGAVYFVTVDSLWRSDGTPEGTRKLRTFDVSTGPRSLLPFGDSLLFLAGDASTGPALWQTRGTPETTVLLSQPAPEAPTSFAGPLTRMGNRALFPVIRSGAADIWETDGSSGGTRRLTAVCGTPNPLCTSTAFPLLFPTALGSRYLFALREETYGFELWTADAAGPRLVRDIRHNEGSARALSFVEVTAGEGPARDVAALGPHLLFAARATQEEDATLWVSDGTPAGTVEIGPDIATPNGFVTIGDRVWLRGSWFPWPHPYGAGLWATSGTAAGTSRLADDLTVAGLPGGRPGLVLVSAAGQDPTGQQPTGFEPWVSDGTASGTRILKDIDPLNPPPQPGDTRGSSFPAHFAPLGTQVLFAATSEATGREPWITDGTEAGTRLLRDVNPRSSGSGGDSWEVLS
ncbi:MAG TPA: hypothetical protein DD490_08415, partial [Acidobacteria bacterium]|nr:hypothetical protein [Acidobacteriota bacterium]